MTIKMTSLNDDKSDISQFFYHDLFHIVNTIYAQNFMSNGQNDTACFFTAGLLARSPPLPHPSAEIFKKAQPR